MTADFEALRLLDKTGQDILYLLQEDARMPFAEIGRRVGLSAPSVAERVRRMEEAGIIEGYHARVNLDKVGLPVTVYIEITSSDGRTDLIQKFAVSHPAVSECYCITGERDILIRASFGSIKELDQLVQQLARYGKVSTAAVMAVYRARRSVGDAEPRG